MINQHNDDCPDELVEHIAEIEAGWTLPKWWKTNDERVAQADNQNEIRQMLARWATHGYKLTDVPRTEPDP